MMEHKHNSTYIAIDLKSFYASVECVARGLNPLSTHLVVADESRTEKTICLAVSPSLKALGVASRPRLFEVIERVATINARRRAAAPDGILTHTSTDARVTDNDPTAAVDYIVAPPRMAHYIECSERVYDVYLRYIAPEDMHVYSVDEVFIDATPYLVTGRQTPHEFASTIIKDVLATTGVTATAGIGTNMYLCKIAMDIVAKHIPPDADGVRIASLDERSYREQLWDHRPLTDFWRVGRAMARRLEAYGLHTMGDVARQSLRDDELLYREFGVNAELLIDHAWGCEPCTMPYVKAYRPTTTSISNGQVLAKPYTCDKALVVVREMADDVAMDLLAKRLVTDRVTLTIGYDAISLNDETTRQRLAGHLRTNRYGRTEPQRSHGTERFNVPTSLLSEIEGAVTSLFHRIIDKQLLVRHITVTADNLQPESAADVARTRPVQLDLFADNEGDEQRRRNTQAARERERRMQQTLLNIKARHGKNAILKGLNFDEGATARERNNQIGGHKA